MDERFVRSSHSEPTDAQRAFGARFRASFELFVAATVQHAWSNERVRGALRRQRIEIESAPGRRALREARAHRELAVEHVNCWTEGWLEKVGELWVPSQTRPGPDSLPADFHIGLPRWAHLEFQHAEQYSLDGTRSRLDVYVQARELTGGISEIPPAEREFYVHRLAALGDRLVAGLHDFFVSSSAAVPPLKAPRPIDFADLEACVRPHFVQCDLLRGIGPELAPDAAERFNLPQ